MEGLPSKRIALKVDVIGPGGEKNKIYILFAGASVHPSFSRKHLPAGTVKGLSNHEICGGHTDVSHTQQLRTQLRTDVFSGICRRLLRKYCWGSEGDGKR